MHFTIWPLAVGTVRATRGRIQILLHSNAIGGDPEVRPRQALWLHGERCIIVVVCGTGMPGGKG